MGIFQQDESPKRPASVWIAQILMGLITLIYAGIAGMIVLNIGPLLSLAAIITISVALAVSAIALVAFIGMARRKSYGRWTAIGLLALILLSGSIQVFIGSGNLLGQLIPALLFGWLAFVLIRSEAVSRFFAKPESCSGEPPPVETYMNDISRRL